MKSDGRGVGMGDGQEASSKGCLDYGCVAVVAWTVAVVVDLGSPPGRRALPIGTYFAVIGLLWFGYYRKRLPWGALVSGLQIWTVFRLVQRFGVDQIAAHLIRR